MPAAWMDRGGLPDPMRMVADMMRDPFGGLTQLDRWFGDFSPASFQPDIDVVDDKDAIRIVAELPGVDKKDVQVTIEDDYIVINGEKKLERRAEEQGAYRVERAFGSFQRVIPLAEGVDTEHAEAKFENGTLTIRLPKTQAAQTQGRRLNISSPPQSAPQQGTGTSPGTPQQR
jgi:HSP20 family protein